MATLGKSIIHINKGGRIHESSSLEFYSADTPMVNIKPAGGSTAIFVISASMVSASRGFIGLQSGSLVPAFSGSHTGSIIPASSSYIRIRSNEKQFNAFNLQIMSSSFTSTASLNSMPYPAVTWHTASVGMEQADSDLAHAIYNSFAIAHSSSLAARVRTRMTASSDYRKRLPAISASLDSVSNAVKIFVQRTGSAIIDFSGALTSSYGFSIETLRTGSGQLEYPYLDLGFKMNPIFNTSSFSMRLSDSTGKGFVLEADGHIGVSGSSVGSSNQSYPKTFFMSQSGQFGINTLNPHAEFEVSGTLSASVVDTPSITVAGRDVVTFTAARANNVAIFGDIGIVDTGADTFKANTLGDITAVRQITSSGGISTTEHVHTPEIIGGSAIGDQSGSLTLSGSLTFRDNEATPAVSASTLYNSGSTLYWAGNAHESKFPVAPKQLLFFPHGLADTNLTTKHYVPWMDTTEQTTAYSQISQFIAPTDCRLKKVLWNNNQWNGDTVVSMSLEKWDVGDNNLSGTPDIVGQVSVAYDDSEQSHHTIVMDFENDLDAGVGEQDNFIKAGQRALIGLITEDDVQVGAGYLNLTSVWEADYSTMLSGSTA